MVASLRAGPESGLICTLCCRVAERQGQPALRRPRPATRPFRSPPCLSLGPSPPPPSSSAPLPRPRRRQARLPRPGRRQGARRHRQRQGRGRMGGPDQARGPRPRPAAQRQHPDAHHGPTTVVEMTPEKKVVWRYEAKPKAGIQGAASRSTPSSGSTTARRWSPRSGNAPDRRGGSGTGKVVLEVPLTVEHPNPHRDTRMARKLRQRPLPRLPRGRRQGPRVRRRRARWSGPTRSTSAAGRGPPGHGPRGTAPRSSAPSACRTATR